MYFGFVDLILLHSGHRRSRGHRQGGENKNANINASKSRLSLQIISLLVEIHG